MPPKSVVRKLGSDVSLPPLEQTRSALSVGLAAMAERQKEAFDALSPDGHKMYSAIHSLNRYDILTNPDGEIACTQVKITGIHRKLNAALQDFSACFKKIEALVSPEIADEETAAKMVEQKNNLMHYSIKTAQFIKTISGDLVEQMKTLAKLEEEVVALEKIVLSDELLPNLENLRNATVTDVVTESEVAAVVTASEIEALIGKPGEDISPETCVELE